MGASWRAGVREMSLPHGSVKVVRGARMDSPHDEQSLHVYGVATRWICAPRALNFSTIRS